MRKNTTRQVAQKNGSGHALFNQSAKQVVGDAANRWLERNRSLVLRQTPVWAQTLALIVVGLGTISVFGAIFFKIDEVVTAVGQLQSVSGSTDVKTPAGGKVSEVFFKDGELVQAGDLLLKFDTRQASNEKDTLAKLIRLEQGDLANKIAILKERENVLMKKLQTAQSIVNDLQQLVKQGGFQRVQYLQQLDSLYELQSQVSSLQLEMRRIQIEANKSLGQMQNRLRQADLQLQYQTVRAPVSGIVFESKASVDGVLQAGHTILTLIPQEGLKAEIFIPNKDIGFVRPGQIAQVRVDAFPFTRYGELKGVVSRVGADALPPDDIYNYYRFPVTLDLNHSYLQRKDVKVPLQSGMSITANLKLREKRVISLVSDMFVDQTESVKTLRQQ